MKNPASFFKFVSKDRADILSGGMIRFTPPLGLNDPFELNPEVYHLSRCWIEHVSKNDSPNTEFDDADYRYSIDRFNKLDEYKEKAASYAQEHGVLSLSASYDTSENPALLMGHRGDPRNNLLMWAHYCESHTGFVIEFYPDFLDGDKQKVIYTEDRPLLTFEDIDSSGDFPYLFKSTEWEYENEWRCFRPLNDADKILDPGIHLFSFRKRSVKSVTFGCGASEKTRKAVLDILAADPDYANVETFFAKVGEERFELDFHQEIHKNGSVWSNASPFQNARIDTQKVPGNY
ncbi:hypothetical protein BCY88_07380 [Paraburkholderia fungorum]|uniref:DUF2971 domain-containing protein n=2 Tax=Paraburkholderia fungorum TaxID=134537 RepID=A0A3R7GQ71_9BURK|nr:hypothetical protein BCY88_07380 [Paraburkholderia fungorum]